MTKKIEIRKRDLIGALLLLIVVCAWLYDRNSLRNELDATIANSNAKDTIQQRFKDELGREHVKGQVRDYTIAQLKASNDSNIVALRKEIGNIKNLMTYMKVSTTTSGTITTVNKDTTWVVDKKTVQARKFTYTDRWLKLTGLSTTDSTKVSYALDNVQKTTWKYERENKMKFWKPKNLIFEIESENPSTTVNKVQTIRVSPERKKFWETQWFAGLVGVGGGMLIQGRVVSR